MMLVMTTTGVFDGCHRNLIDATWRQLNGFVPQLQAELNPTVPSVTSHPTMPSVTSQPTIPLVMSQEQLSTRPDEKAPVNVEVVMATREKPMTTEHKDNHNGNWY